jgi:hypothetical protein
MIPSPFLLPIIQKSRHHQKLAFLMVSTFILQMHGDKAEQERFLFGIRTG